MFDTIINSEFPLEPPAAAGYVDGGIGNQPNYAYVVRAFPKAHHLSIALSAAHDAMALDCEQGAASVADFPAWSARQRKLGIARPVLYCSASTAQTQAFPMLTRAGITLASIRLWTAHYGQGEHVCGPGSCGQLSLAADGTQWTPAALGRVLDQSLLAADFFGGPPAPPKPPANWVFGPVRDLAVVSTGPTSVKLSWVSPGTAMPAAVAWYQVCLRLAGRDVGSYPRIEPKTANPQLWQGGSLKPGTTYEALVRAVAADGGHQSPWATASFRTAG